MKKKAYYFSSIFFLLASVFILYGAFFGERKITTEICREAEKTALNKEKIDSIYKQSFALAKNKPDYLSSYVPKYNSEFFNDAEKITDNFDNLSNVFDDTN